VKMVRLLVWCIIIKSAIMPPNSTSSSGRSNDLLDDIFDLLRLANELEEKDRIEAATKVRIGRLQDSRRRDA